MSNYDEIIESFINGQYTQAYEQFKSLGHWEMSGFTTDLQNDDLTSDKEKVKYLVYLLDRKVSDK